jgi:catechol 2,3-dioxygenase-like lactoylglutathione lyase family enzyme
VNEIRKVRPIGINHVALEVGDVEQALAFYGRVFDFTLRGQSENMAFIDLGDQFIALMRVPSPRADAGRHVGLVVDDGEGARRALAAAGIDCLPGRFLDFRDPWGNRIQIVDYANVQFSKAPHVLRGMKLLQLRKTSGVLEELAAKGMQPDRGEAAGAAAPRTSEPGSAHSGRAGPQRDEFHKGLANIVGALESALRERGVERSAVDLREGSESAGADITVTVDGEVQAQHFAYEEIQDCGEAIDAPVAVKVRTLVSHFVR